MTKTKTNRTGRFNCKATISTDDPGVRRLSKERNPELGDQTKKGRYSTAIVVTARAAKDLGLPKSGRGPIRVDHNAYSIAKRQQLASGTKLYLNKILPRKR